MSDTQQLAIGFLSLCVLGGVINLFLNRGNGTYPRRVIKDSVLYEHLRDKTHYLKIKYFLSGFLFVAVSIALFLIIGVLILAYITGDRR